MNRTVDDYQKKKGHILKKYTKCHLSSHHLISYQFFDRLTEERIYQMEGHNYNWNGSSNIIIIPHDGGSQYSKMVACHYGLPFHSSAHQGDLILKQWEDTEEERIKKKSTLNKGADPFAVSSKQKKGIANNKSINIYKEDIKRLDEKKFNGYHKCIFGDFKTMLKKLECNLTNIEYQGHLDSLSEDICQDITSFFLLLSNPGYNFAKNQIGCGEEKCNGRQHKSISGEWPKQEDIEDYMYTDNRLKLMDEL